MVSKGRHTKPDVAAALDRAKTAGLDVEEFQPHRRHRWGQVLCPCGEKLTVWCTPENQGNHAKKIDRFARNHNGH